MKKIYSFSIFCGLTVSMLASCQVVVKHYDITFNVEGETTVVPTVEGALPSYGPNNPTKAPDERYTYTFAGWNPALEPAKEDKTYVATFTPTAKQVTISWNVEGAITTTKVNIGETPSYGSTPTKAPDDKYTYAFSKWNPTPVPATVDATYVAEFTPSAKSYTVAFNQNGGTGGSLASESYTYSDLTQTINFTKSSRTGYTDSYSIERTGTYGGDTPTVSGNVITIPGESYGPFTLKANWTANKYTVTFNPNGGTCDTSSKEVTYGTNYGDLPTPTLEGNVFVGWYTESTGGTKISSTDTYLLTDNQTLFAHWALKHTVTLDKQGGTGGDDSVAVANGYDMPDITLPTKAGYVFNGYWSEISGAGKQYYKADGTSANSWDKDQDATLYASWTAAQYTVTFNANGGTCDPASKTVTYNEQYGVLPTPTKERYTFLGWFTAIDGGNEIKADTTVTITDNQTLFAHWSLNAYKAVNMSYEGDNFMFIKSKVTNARLIEMIQTITFKVNDNNSVSFFGQEAYQTEFGEDWAFIDSALKSAKYGKGLGTSSTITFTYNEIDLSVIIVDDDGTLDATFTLTDVNGVSGVFTFNIVLA